MHYVQRSDEGTEGRELEKRRRGLTARDLQNKQLPKFSQLIQQQVEEERRAGAHFQSCIDHTPDSNQCLVQLTPEREENLRSYLRRHSHREVCSPRARHKLFHSDTAPASRSPALTTAAAGNRRELAVREGLREQIGQERVSAILENEGTEGQRDAMQRERDKYASLPEMRPALEETQMRMAEQSLSPGPPPLPGTDLRPQYRLYRSNSDMELTCLADNEPATIQPDYWENTIPVRDYIHPSHSLPAVYRATGEIDPLAPPPAHPSLIPPVAGEPSVLHKIADNLSQLLRFQQQQQQQQQQQEFVHSAPFYASSVPQTQVAPPTTPLPQFTCYPPSTPGLPPQQPAHYFPPPLSSTPHHIPYFPSYLPAPAPSPMPYYQSLPPYPPLYPAPVPFYTTYAPVYIHHSLPTPAPTGLYPANQWLQTLPPVPPPVPATQPPPLLLSPPLSQSQESRVFKLRDILNTMGGVESRAQVYEELKSQTFKVLELELMIEKLKRDNEILKCKLRTTTTTLVPGGSFILLLFLFTVDSHQKQQAIQTHIRKNIQLKEHLNQLIEQYTQLLSEIRHLQSVKFPPNPSSQIPPKMPPIYTPPNEKLGAKQEQYAPIRNEHRTRSGEWHYIHKLTPLLSYNSIWKQLNRETDIR